MKYRELAFPLAVIACLAGALFVPGSAGAVWKYHRPSAPTDVSVLAGGPSAPISVNWSAPVSDGRSPILSDAVADSYTGAIRGGCWVSAAQTSCTFNPPRRTGGLFNDTRYVIRVEAINRMGAGPSTTATIVIPEC